MLHVHLVQDIVSDNLEDTRRVAPSPVPARLPAPRSQAMGGWPFEARGHSNVTQHSRCAYDAQPAPAHTTKTNARTRSEVHTPHPNMESTSEHGIENNQICRYWGFFRYKKRSISIQDIIIYHHISCCYHHILLCIIFSIMIYHVSRRHMISMI